VCLVMPFHPCYTCVGTAPDPDLCYSCVGPATPGQPFARASRTQRSAARRPAAVGHPLDQPSIQLPRDLPGNDAPRRTKRASIHQITHIAEYSLLIRIGHLVDVHTRISHSGHMDGARAAKGATATEPSGYVSRYQLEEGVCHTVAAHVVVNVGVPAADINLTKTSRPGAPLG
jgi:hypothetical protein